MYELVMLNFAMHVLLDKDETDKVQLALQYKIIKKNSLLLKSGDICRSIYFVNKGCLRIFNTDDNGDEHNISFFPEFWWAADISSFSTQTAAFYTISALEDSEVFQLDYTVFEKLLITVPKMERFFRILVQNGFHLYQLRITSNLSKPAEERYEEFQRQYPGLEQRISQKHIASYVGITPVFLSKVRKKMFG